ncbi:protein of unknown function [Marinobacter daqiaonensis]|uniref:DUF4397 domain-containing protein n=1 Tax=Marinobacter daqiaonensis TaxID=650891 RepID=A0A1I6IKS2_9GAMM|nr:DUF4397 domain-containing protein [Marinobacter daqiaonensis]SFR67332.1 protein of unknown function [Marinobacter daqiaonensis]
MNRFLALPLVVAGGLMLAGCDDDSDSALGTVTEAEVRIIHASPDAPPVNILVDGEAAVEGADYKEVALLTPPVGDYDLAVQGIIPGVTGDAAIVIGPANFTFEDGIRYNVVAVDTVAGIRPLTFNDTDPDFSSTTDVRVRIGHLAPNAPAVDVYVTAAGDGDDLSMTDPLLANVSFEDVADAVEVPAGDYRVQITANGATQAVFDSGSVSLPAGADLFIGAVQNTGANASATGASPVSLIVVNGADVSEIYDADQNAGVRVVHNSADAPEVDVLVDDTEALANIAFTEAAPSAALDEYASLPADTYNIKVAASADNSIVPIEADLTLANGQGYTVAAVGLLGDNTIEALVLEDSVRSIGTQASLRVVHGATAAGNVDVYLLPGDQTAIGNASPTLEDVPFKAVTGYLPVPQGTYNLRITDTDGNIAISADGVALDNGGVYTVIARDGQPTLTDFGLILLDDFVQP